MIRRMRWLTVVLGVMAVLAATAPAHAHAASAEDELFVLEERVIELPAPAPGERTPWTFRVENVSDDVVPVFVAVTRVEGALFAGREAGEVSVGVEGAEPVLAGPAPTVLADGHVSLATLPARGELRVRGEIGLPRSAGNEYQGASGALTVQVAAARDIEGRDTVNGGRYIAVTGGMNPWPWGTAAACALIAGALLLARNRRRAAATFRENHDTRQA